MNSNPPPSTASLIIIGDEILSGRTVDQNSIFLIRQLSKLGVRVQRCITVPDEQHIIAETIKEQSRISTWCFTAGGIGPTLDDVTMAGIAKAFDLPLIIEPLLAALMNKIYHDDCTTAHMKMAKVPLGTEILQTEDSMLFGLKLKNIFILPGVPRFLKAVFSSIQTRFYGVSDSEKEIDLLVNEGLIAEYLQQTLNKFPEIKIGSYPVFLHNAQRLKIVLRHQQPDYLGQAFDYLKNELKDFL